MHDHDATMIIDEVQLARICGGSRRAEVEAPYVPDEAGFPVCDSVCREILSARPRASDSPRVR